MLRGLVIALLAANALFFAWSQGHLAAWGWPSDRQSEPQRMAQQIAPEAVVLRPHTPPPAVVAVAPSADTTCWRVDGLDTAQWTAWQSRIAALGLPAQAWSAKQEAGDGGWLIYMGRFEPEQLRQKTAELQRAGVAFQVLQGGVLAPGLSLGRFDSEDAAREGLQALAPKGVRTARLQMARPELALHHLRLQDITEAQREALSSLEPPLRRCE